MLLKACLLAVVLLLPIAPAVAARPSPAVISRRQDSRGLLVHQQRQLLQANTSATPISLLAGPQSSSKHVTTEEVPPKKTATSKPPVSDETFTAAETSVTGAPTKGCQFVRGVAYGAPNAVDQQGNLLAPGFQWDPALNPLLENVTAALQTVTMGSGWQLQAADNAAQCCKLCLAHTDSDPKKPGTQVIGKPCDAFSWVPSAAWGVHASLVDGAPAAKGAEKAKAIEPGLPGACLLITLGPQDAATALVWGTASNAHSGVPYL